LDGSKAAAAARERVWRAELNRRTLIIRQRLARPEGLLTGRRVGMLPFSGRQMVKTMRCDDLLGRRKQHRINDRTDDLIRDTKAFDWARR
jgi:hypothetical protein